MKIYPYIHLRTQSSYSLSESTIKIQTLVDLVSILKWYVISDPWGIYLSEVLVLHFKVAWNLLSFLFCINSKGWMMDVFPWPGLNDKFIDCISSELEPDILNVIFSGKLIVIFVISIEILASFFIPEEHIHFKPLKTEVHSGCDKDNI